MSGIESFAAKHRLRADHPRQKHGGARHRHKNNAPQTLPPDVGFQSDGDQYYKQ